MIKKILVFIMSLSLIMPLFSISAFAKDDKYTNGSNYETNGHLTETIINEFISSSSHYTVGEGCYIFTNDAKQIEANSFAKETLVIIPIDPIYNDNIESKINNLMAAKGGGYNSYSEWDSSGAICATVYVEYNTIANGSYAKLTYVSTSRTSVSSGVLVSTSSVSYGSTGSGYQNTYALGQSNYVNLGNASSWSTYTPSSWNYVELAADHLIGATYSLTLHRGSSSHYWNLYVTNIPI